MGKNRVAVLFRVSTKKLNSIKGEKYTVWPESYIVIIFLTLRKSDLALKTEKERFKGKVPAVIKMLVLGMFLSSYFDVST